MFSNIYKHRLLCSLRSIDVLIWTWIFPFVLATLFYFAFANLDTAENFQPVRAAVIDNADWQDNTAFRKAMEALSDGENKMLDLTVAADVEEADSLLRDGTVAVYITPGEHPRLTVRESGLDQSILQSILDSYQQQAASISYILTQNPDAGPELFRETDSSFTLRPADGGQERNSSVPYFFAMIGMVCLYACFQGLVTVTNIQPNLSRLGARVSLAPVGKLKMIFYDSLAGITVHYIACALVVLYICLLTGMELLRDLPLILAVCFAGSLAGYALGTAVGALGRMKESVKSGLLIVISLSLSFMAGLMVEGISYQIEKHAPVLSWLNPAARISDALYRLYYYDTYELYLIDLAVLIAMAAALFAISGVLLRRRKYESI